ncbi:astacin [Cooperia oncophora]
MNLCIVILILYCDTRQPKNVFKVQDTIHEIIHALGVEHMQKRYDRDNYIKVNLSSFKTIAHEDQLRKMQPDELINYTPYEYGSIMHYRADSGIDGLLCDYASRSVVHTYDGLADSFFLRLDDAEHALQVQTV